MDAVERLNAWASGGALRMWSVTLGCDGAYYVRAGSVNPLSGPLATTADKDLLVAVEAAISELEGRDES